MIPEPHLSITLHAISFVIVIVLDIDVMKPMFC
jgi:hypothetical protein